MRAIAIIAACVCLCQNGQSQSTAKTSPSVAENVSMDHPSANAPPGGEVYKTQAQQSQQAGGNLMRSRVGSTQAMTKTAKAPQKSFFQRNKTPLIIGAAVLVAMIIASLVGGFVIYPKYKKGQEEKNIKRITAALSKGYTVSDVKVADKPDIHVIVAAGDTKAKTADEIKASLEAMKKIDGVKVSDEGVLIKTDNPKYYEAQLKALGVTGTTDKDRAEKYNATVYSKFVGAGYNCQIKDGGIFVVAAPNTPAKDTKETPAKKDTKPEPKPAEPAADAPKTPTDGSKKQ